MSKSEIKRYNNANAKRAVRVRARIKEESSRPRLTIFRSSKYVYAQVIDDQKHHTIASSWGKKSDEVGKTVAEKAIKSGVKEVVFDRAGYKYHGVVKLLADAARAAGLKF